ncbi:MAG: hypothetical protein C0490_05695 [Marivirga sp.]|nr:hypothetical protein [Marivirga sp.]
MLTLRKAGDHFFLDHFVAKSGKHLTYRFYRKKLPQRTVAHLDSLPAFKTSEDTVLILNNKQNAAITDVFNKIVVEEASGYAYSEQLIQTYLIELIHLITKIHQGNLPPV